MLLSRHSNAGESILSPPAKASGNRLSRLARCSLSLLLTALNLLTAHSSAWAATRTWTGTTSTSWSTSSNWDTGVPGGADAAVIPSGAARYPNITSALPGIASLTINSGASVTMGTGGSLSMTGNFQNDGTYTMTGGTLSVKDLKGTGTFDVSGGTINISHDYKPSGGTFTATGGTVVFTGTAGNGAFPSNVSTTQFFNVQFDADAGIDNNAAVSISVAGDWINNNAANSLTSRATTITFNGTGAQTIGGTSSTTFNNLTMSKSSGTLTLGGNIAVAGNWTNNGGTLSAGTSTVTFSGASKTIGGTTSTTFNSVTVTGTITLDQAITIAGDLTVSAGTLDLSTYTANRSTAGGTLTVANGATLKIGGTNGFPLNYSTHTLGSTSTVEYSGTNQTVSNESYGHLTLSGSGTKTMPGSAMTVGGNFSLSGTVSVTAAADLTVNGNVTIGSGTTFDGSSFTHTIKGNWSNSGTFTSSTSTIVMAGTSAQTKTGSTSYNLTINNAAGVTFNSSETVDNTLTLTSGKITLGSNSLTIASGGSISGGSSSSYIVTNSTGVLTRNSVGASDVLFPVGTASTYNPVTINNAGTADNFSVRVQSSFDNAPNDANTVVNRQWTITEATAGGSNATITLQWNTADEAAGFVRANPIYIGRHTGSQWVQTAATFTDVGGGVYTASASGFSSFSPFGVGNDAALPIQLASFSASVLRGRDVEVIWKTISETNNYGFEVHRKRGELGEWTKLGFVPGHGTTLEPYSYSYIDRSVPFGKYYYRLKQIDLDGKSEKFRELEVTVGLAPDRMILAQNYPNPFNPSTLIEFVVPQSGYTTLKVYNILGQEVGTLFDGVAEAGEIHAVLFDASRFASGLYFYTLRSAGKIETKRMLLLK